MAAKRTKAVALPEDFVPDIIDTPVTDEMSVSFLSYAMSVIVSRALPDVRDGLKPVHRRILYSMYDSGLRPDRSFVKCARVVGDCFVAGTLVRGDKGLIRVEDVKVGDIVLDGAGRPGEVDSLYYNPPQQLLKVTFPTGQSLTVTKGQKFRTIDPRTFEMTWTRADELTTRSIVLAPDSNTLPEPDTDPLSPRAMRAYVAGLLVAEGWQRDRRSSHEEFGLAMADIGPVSKAKDYFVSIGILTGEATRPRDGRMTLHELRGKGDQELYSVCSNYSKDRRIPEWVLKDRSLHMAFLAGYQDGDGAIRPNRSEIVYTSTSLGLLEDVQQILSYWGTHSAINASAAEGWREGRSATWQLTLTGPDASTVSAWTQPHSASSEKIANSERVRTATRQRSSASRSLPLEPIKSELSKYRKGSWWVRPNGTSFRRSELGLGPDNTTMYSTGRVRVSYQNIVANGVLEILKECESPMHSRLQEILGGYRVLSGAVVEVCDTPEITYDFRVATESHEVTFNGIAASQCMGKYHPHGDSAIYEAMVRMAQDFSMRLPTIDGHGNFGTHADGAAAMRYCLSGSTKVLMSDGTSKALTDIANGLLENSEKDVDLTVISQHGTPVRADRIFNSGVHPMKIVRTQGNFKLEGTYNHPIMCLVEVGGVPTMVWKLLEEVKVGDWAVLYRGQSFSDSAEEDKALAYLAGGLTAEGWVTSHTIGFNNTDKYYFDTVLSAWDKVIGSPRNLYTSTLPSGKTLLSFETSYKDPFLSSSLAEMINKKAAEKRVPKVVWGASPAFKAAYLASAWTGDGSVSTLPRNALQISYSTYSKGLAEDMQLLLLELGIFSRVTSYKGGEYKIWISNRRDAQLFAARVGFLGEKHTKLMNILAEMPDGVIAKVSLGKDAVPFLNDYLRRRENVVKGSGKWVAKHNMDRITRWETHGHEILPRITSEAYEAIQHLVSGTYRFVQIESVEEGTPQEAYSLRVDTNDHSYITDGFISHNTEARMAHAALAMTDELSEQTVNFVDNYDGKMQEPSVMPAKFPNLLVNGSTGIAVGMATNMAPHNLLEAVEACKHMLLDPNATSEDLMKFIPAPDFPTGGVMVGSAGAKEAYLTGKGQITVRARTEFIDVTARKRGIRVTELPYQVGPEKVITRIKEVKDARKLEGVAMVQDLSDRHHGLSLVIELKSGVNEKAVLRELFRLTPLQESFSIHNLALVDTVPKTLTLRELVGHYVNHRLEVTRRRSEYRKNLAEERAHKLEGYLIALANIDEVVACIRASKDATVARTKLMKQFVMSEIQASSVLEMPLRRLTSLEVNKIKSELAELKKTIKELTALLASDKLMRALVADELTETALELGTPRRTTILGEEAESAALEQEEIELDIKDEPTTVWLTASGHVGRAPALTGRATKADLMLSWVSTSTRATVGLITNAGRMLPVPVHELGDAAESKTRGPLASEVVELIPGETVIGLADLTKDLIMVTTSGLVKRLSAADFPKKSGQEVIIVKDDDHLLAAIPVLPSDVASGDLFMLSSDAQLLRTPLLGINPKGAKAGGMAGMRLSEGATVIAAGVLAGDGAGALITCTDTSMVKVTDLSEYPVKGRGTAGVRAHRFTRGSTALSSGALGPLASLALVSDKETLLPLPSVLGKRDGAGDHVEGAKRIVGMAPKSK